MTWDSQVLNCILPLVDKEDGKEGGKGRSCISISVSWESEWSWVSHYLEKEYLILQYTCLTYGVYLALHHFPLSGFIVD